MADANLDLLLEILNGEHDAAAFTEPDLARILNRSREWLSARRIAGTGPRAVHISNRQLFYAGSDVRAWLVEQREKPTRRRSDAKPRAMEVAR